MNESSIPLEVHDHDSRVAALADIAEPAAPLPPIFSGVDLAKALDVPLDEGVVVAVFPAEIAETLAQEVAYVDKRGRRTYAVLVNAGAWGERMIDVETISGNKVKWWQVKEAARVARLDLVPLRWEGPIGEIPSDYFTKPYVLGIRFYKHGPWFFPKEQPKRVADPGVEAALEAGNE